MRLDALLRESIAALKPFSDAAPKEVMMLLMQALSCDELAIMTQPEREVDTQLIAKNLARLQNGEPIEYVIEQVSFYAQHFFIAPGALIPRPETELLVDEVKKHLPKTFAGVIADVGTGSGIIAITLAQHFTQASIMASDISAEALAIAQKNIEHYALQERITLLQGDLLNPLPKEVDVVVSNPPYIAKGYRVEKKLTFEPASALFASEHGDEIVLRLIDEAKAKGVNYLFCEYGYDQRSAVKAHCNTLGIDRVSFYQDYSQFERGFCITFERGNNE